MRIIKAHECETDFINFFKDNSLVPIIGSGLSVGVKTERGLIPSGKEYRNHMLDRIKKTGKIDSRELEELERLKFSELAGVYEDDEIMSPSDRRRFFEDNFSRANYSNLDSRRQFFEIEWPYVYSLNIDDVVERSTAFNTILIPNREINDSVFENHKCLLKLHGDINDMLTYDDSYKVFTSKEYVSSLSFNRSMLNKLATDYGNTNILFIGCSLLDELDLLAIDKLQFDRVAHFFSCDKVITKCAVEKRNFFFCVGEPTTIEKSRYKNFGITDVVVFDKFDSMYRFLFDAWTKSTEVRDDSLDNFSHFAVRKLKSSDIVDNNDFFYMALNMVDYNNKVVTIPYFTIRREATHEILNEVGKKSVQIVIGQRFSGKSTILSDIYSTIIDRERFLFDARIRLSNKALNQLLDHSNAVLLFDTDALNRNQIEYVFRNIDRIKDNSISVIIMLHSHDSEDVGLIQLLTETGIVKERDYKIYREFIRNRFSKEETKRINKLLPEVRLQPYSNKDTIINHLMETSFRNKVKSKYSDKSIPAKDIKEIAFSIAIASKEALYYSDIVELEFEDIVGNVLFTCSPLIEILPTNLLEKSPSDMSGSKYVLNSKYWIRNGLLELVNSNRNNEVIEAYRYLILRLIDFSKEDLNKRRNKYRDIILFNTINTLFGGKNGGKRDLVAQIYASLNDLLGTDYQYNHQRAKCLMRNAFYQKTIKAKEESYEDARRSALIARTQVENEYNESKSNKLLISLAHIEYSYASIIASVCNLHMYSDISEIEDVINSCYKAVVNPYNEDDFYREKDRDIRYGIIFFIKSVMNNEKMNNLSSETRNRYDELLRRIVLN